MKRERRPVEKAPSICRAIFPLRGKKKKPATATAAEMTVTLFFFLSVAIRAPTSKNMIRVVLHGRKEANSGHHLTWFHLRSRWPLWVEVLNRLLDH
jgi:hypothetical protein